MHHQVGVGQTAMDLLDHVHGQHLAVGLAGELVGAVRGAHGDGQRVDLGLAHELHRLVGIGQQLGVVELALEAVAVLLLAHAGLQRAQHAEFALDRGADPVGHLHHVAGDAHIVLVAGRGLGVALQRAVHHHTGEAVLDGGGAGGFVVAVILVHADRDVGVDVDQGVDHAGEHDVVGVLARAPAGLDDDRAVGPVGGLHDGEALFHIVDIECRDAVAVLSRMVEKLSEGDAGHASLLVSSAINRSPPVYGAPTADATPNAGSLKCLAESDPAVITLQPFKALPGLTLQSSSERRYRPCRPQAGRRARKAWAMVPSSSQSNSPPTGTPRAREVTETPEGFNRSIR